MDMNKYDKIVELTTKSFQQCILAFALVLGGVFLSSVNVITSIALVIGTIVAIISVVNCFKAAKEQSKLIKEGDSLSTISWIGIAGLILSPIAIIYVILLRSARNKFKLLLHEETINLGNK